MASSLWPCRSCGSNTRVMAEPWSNRAKRFGGVVRRYRKCHSCGRVWAFAEFGVGDPAAQPLTDTLLGMTFHKG